jgi:putative phage-type endonuclease
MVSLIPVFSKDDIGPIHAAIDALLKPILFISNEDCKLIENLEQRSPGWHDSRRYRLTASNFGAAVGVNKYCSPDQLLVQMISPSFVGNVATRYGTEHEPIACKQYLEELIDFKLSHREVGLVVSQQYPFLGASPDGILSTELHQVLLQRVPPKLGESLILRSFDISSGPIAKPLWSPPLLYHRFLLEIKCPFRKQLFPGQSIEQHVPHYYAQIQGCMQVMDLPYCHFYTWTPNESKIECYPRNDEYWNVFLYPALKKFYFTRFIPLLFLHSRGLLSNVGNAIQWLTPISGCDRFVETVFAYCNEIANSF